jgi:hypothetical protein
MRIALALAASALMLSATASAEIAARHGMTGDQYQTEFNQITAQGFRLTDVDGFMTPQGMRYAAIWLKSASSRPWVARHGLNAQQFQQHFDKNVAQGFRLMDVSVADGGVFAGLWEKGGGPAWESRAGLDSQAFTNNFNEKSGAGFRPIDIEGYQEGGKTKFAVIWTKNTNNRAWYLYRDMTLDGFQQKFNELSAQGFQPVKVDGYATPSGARFAGIWEKKGGAYIVRGDMTHDAYQQQWNAQAANGFTLKSVSGYVDGAQVKYNAIWTK